MHSCIVLIIYLCVSLLIKFIIFEIRMKIALTQDGQSCVVRVCFDPCCVDDNSVLIMSQCVHVFNVYVI